jgi:hypothetical protein
MKYLTLVALLLFSGFANAQTTKTKTFFVEELTPIEYKNYTEAKKELEEAKQAEQAVENGLMAHYGDTRIGPNYTLYKGGGWYDSKPYTYKQVEIKGDYALISKTTCTPSNDSFADCKEDFSVKELSATQKRSLQCAQEELAQSQQTFDDLTHNLKISHYKSVGLYEVCEIEIRGKYFLITIKQTVSVGSYITVN